MKGSFIIAFLLLEFIAALNGSALQAQTVLHKNPDIKNNFSSFTRKYTNRGKLWMARNKTYQHHPDANLGDQYSPNNKAVELFEKRTVDTKFFINSDNPSIVYSQWSSSPIHYKKNGQWITIDTRLRLKGPLVYEASNQEDPLGFDVKRKSSYITTPDGKTYFNNWRLYGENGGTETLLAIANWSQFTAGDDGIAIKNIFPGIDAEMKLSRGSIKTNFIVHANKFSKYKTLLFRDAFLNGRSGKFTFSNGLPGNGFASSADFRVGSGTVFHVNRGVMYQKENPSSTYKFIPYYLDQNKLTLAISGDLLNTQLRIGDVVMDPLVQDMGVLNKDMITGSHSNQDCSLDTACEYDFQVPAPAGATLIDAQFSFGFVAKAPCVGQDGAFSFGISGGCASQIYEGTAAIVGPQNFPNQSILLKNGAGIAACLPAPACGPQDIPFNFYFYRKCHGPEGCDGSCIGAEKNLTITIVGRTFDSASLTASPQNTCAGNPVTLTAAGYYGVPPYYFIWQGLPQFNGDSVIQVQPNANTVYSVQVSGACPGKTNAPITKSVNVGISKLPAPALTSNSPVCTGGQLILSAPAVPGTTYYIANPAAGLGGGQYASTATFDNVTAAYAGTWIAVATDVNGCTSDTARTTVVVNPNITPTVTITSSATNICAGALVTFTATAANAGNSPNYQWLLNGNAVGTNSPVYTGSGFANNDAVSCVVTASGACTGGSATSNVIVLHVSALGTPTFDAIGPLCQNSIPPALPPTSKEGIAGTWNPAVINTSAIGTATYTFTPISPGSCSTPTTLNISVVGNLTPTFDAIGPLCQNSTPPALPPTSKEGIAGTWDPAVIITSTLGTSFYKFTPSSTGSCAIPVSINITIASGVTPTFPTIANSYCLNDKAPDLPPTSKEGISGTWSPASITTATVGSTVYTFTPTGGQCGKPAQITIVVNPLPQLNMGQDITIASGSSATLNPSVTGNIVTYQWKPSTGLSDATIKNPVASPSVTTVYTLDVVDDNKCEASGSIKVSVSEVISKVLVPNAFSPNGDGINDTWVITNITNYPGATVNVYDRYGQLVFHSENYSKAWDGTYNGKPLPMATYYYIIDLKNNEKKIAGSVTLFK
jgi:gliding motility-associated-like protein